jgi:hypothetical protein
MEPVKTKRKATGRLHTKPVNLPSTRFPESLNSETLEGDYDSGKGNMIVGSKTEGIRDEGVHCNEFVAEERWKGNDCQ